MLNRIFEIYISRLPDIAKEWFYTWHEHMGSFPHPRHIFAAAQEIKDL